MEVQKMKLYSNKYRWCIYATLYTYYWLTVGIFYWRYPFGRTMALGTTQHLTERSTKNMSGDEG